MKWQLYKSIKPSEHTPQEFMQADLQFLDSLPNCVWSADNRQLELLGHAWNIQSWQQRAYITSMKAGH